MRAFRRSSDLRGVVPMIIGASIVSQARSARADFEFWTPIEVRVPISRTATPSWPRVDLRLVTEPRFAGRFNGLEQLFFRAGPVVYFTPWLFVAAHGTILADALPTVVGMPTRLEEEARAELEPNFFGRLGPFTIVSRNRLEYRWKQTYQRLRFRTQLRVNLAPTGWVVMPFLQNELLFDLWDTRVAPDGVAPTGVSPTPGFNQNRAFVGVGVQLTSTIRLDVAVLLRARSQPGLAEWALDVGPWIGLFVDVPRLGEGAATANAPAQQRPITEAPSSTAVTQGR